MANETPVQPVRSDSSSSVATVAIVVILVLVLLTVVWFVYARNNQPTTQNGGNVNLPAINVNTSSGGGTTGGSNGTGY